MLATIHSSTEPDAASLDAVAVSGISMQTEFEGLSTSIRDLLALSRRLKELWVFGPPGKDDMDSSAAQVERVERDVVRVAELLNFIDAKSMKALAEENGGTWRDEVKSTGDSAPPPPPS
jgi:hypothetical protein